MLSVKKRLLSDTMIPDIIFWLSFWGLYYIYDGYLRLLQLVLLFWRRQPGFQLPPIPLPAITVLVTVFNEAETISDKIRNILDTDYPADLLEVLVASDGSTDGTDDIVKGFDDGRVSLFRPKNRVGKTDTQNQAMDKVTSEIVVFTDAGTRFHRSFLKNIVKPFNDTRVGGVDGHLIFITTEASGVSKSQGFYWNQELRLRTFESKAGILAVASGACLAIRRKLFRPMRDTYGEDCVLPLDIVSQGYEMVHAPDAIAYDRMEHEPEKEFRTRTRMTLRNWQGTWSYPRLLSPFHHPGYAFSLWSHKLFRWMSPVFLILLTMASIWLSWESWFFKIVTFGILGSYLAGYIG